MFEGQVGPRATRQSAVGMAGLNALPYECVGGVPSHIEAGIHPASALTTKKAPRTLRGAEITFSLGACLAGRWISVFVQVIDQVD
jgi:hypothetical protein